MLKTTVVLLVLCLPVHGGQVEAERIKRNFELSAEKYELESKIAMQTGRPVSELERPKGEAAAKGLWQQISPKLKEKWTIPYSAFFLNLTQMMSVSDASGTPQQAFREERERIVDAIKKYHLSAPGIEPFCTALLKSGDPNALAILEDIARDHPSESVQGVAALCAALMLKSLGYEPEVMRKRLEYLRHAIIHSADKVVGDRSVADIATDELYIIRFLTKGRTAPALKGWDVGGREVSLSDFEGRIVVLLFWDATSADTDRVIQLMNQLTEKFADQEVTVLGVTPESLQRIRTLQGEGQIKWNNIHDAEDRLAKEYRISHRPAVLVLDQQGVIQYTGLPGSFVELTIDALLNPE